MPFVSRIILHSPKSSAFPYSQPQSTVSAKLIDKVSALYWLQICSGRGILIDLGMQVRLLTEEKDVWLSAIGQNSHEIVRYEKERIGQHL